MEPPSCDPSVVSSRRVIRDKSSLLPEVEVVDGVRTLTDRGRYQVGLLVIVDITYSLVILSAYLLFFLSTCSFIWRVMLTPWFSVR